MKMKSVKIWTALTLVLAPVWLSADVREISEACEIAVARSAGPVHLRDEAGVYVLGEKGYEVKAESTNGFICMVERNHPDSLIPQCFDERARSAHVALLLDEGRMIREGLTFEVIAEKRKAALDSGQYPAADGPGVAYMISDYNYVKGSSGQVLKLAPHVMYHAPGLSHADIGSVPEKALQNPGMPIIASEGPHGFMIGFTQFASDSSEVIAACKGQLPDASQFPPFPAWD